jgi:hypothetical protein
VTETPLRMPSVGTDAAQAHAALREFESALDAAFARPPLPHPNLHLSNWYLLTVAEDWQRVLFASTEKELLDSRVEYYVDRMKYSLRHSLMRTKAECKDTTPAAIPVRVVPAIYVRARQLLLAGMDYSIGAQICSTVHSGAAQIFKEANGIFQVKIDERLLDKRYGALELMRQTGGEPTVSFSGLVWAWMRVAELVPPPVYVIAESVRLRGRLLRYEFDPDLAFQLVTYVPQPPHLIPEDWEFPWGGRAETTLLINALSLRCMYHVLAVHFGAARLKLRGGGESNLCFCLSRNELLEDMAVISSLNSSHIEAFISFLTYGQRTSAPDSALQPIVCLTQGIVAVTAIGFLASNQERNLLTLQARLDPPTFNRLSGSFEVQMTERLDARLRERWRFVVPNRTFQLGSNREELDLLIAEPETSTMVILELRWMLPPGDPREVQTKKQACHQKVEQLERKTAAARGHVGAVMERAFSLNVTDAASWRVFGIVVVAGFGGARSLNDGIAVMPDYVLEGVIGDAPSLRHLAEWSISLAWLPVEGREFEVEEESKFHLDDVRVRYPGLVPRSSGMEYLDSIRKSLSNSRTNR